MSPIRAPGMPAPGLLACSAALALAALVFAPGCNSWTTYPPVEVTGGMTNPSYEPLPTLMTEAIRFAHDRYGQGGTDYAINLPRGVPAEIYGRVLRKLGTGHPMTRIGEPAYHVLEVRVRGGEAEVDLVYPRMGSIYEMVTISFRNRLVEGWSVLSSRLWRIRVDVPGPNYVEPAPAAVPAPTPPADAAPATAPAVDPGAAELIDPGLA